MAITYSAGVGTTITSALVTETLGSQTGAPSDGVILATANVTPSTHTGYGGDVGGNTNSFGPGDTYVGRLIAVRVGDADEEVKVCTAETDNGATITLTVHEDWTSPPASGDVLHVAYTGDDIEDTQSGGIGYGRKTAVWILSNDFWIGNGTDFAFFMLGTAEGLEFDKGGAPCMTVRNNGLFQAGYLFGGRPINGAYLSPEEDVTGTSYFSCLSGGYVRLYDTNWQMNLHSCSIDIQAGSDLIMYDAKNYSFTYDVQLLDGYYKNIKWTGISGTSEFARIAEATTIEGFLMVSTAGFHTEDADTTTEILTIRDVTFISNLTNITVNSNKTWNVINPTWTIDAGSQNDIDFLTATSNSVNERYSVDAVVQEADGTKLQNALVIVYEGTINDDLVLELVSNVNGIVGDSWIYKTYTDNTTTLTVVTYGNHALRVDKWLYTPFVASQVSNEKFDGSVTLVPDSGIVQTTQATALTAGSGITWNDETNPSSIIAFTGGSGTLAVGNTVTASPSGADGVVTQILSGDSTAGEIHLKTRDAVAFATSDTLSNGAGWTANYTTASQQDFSIWIDGNNLSLQVIYDYLAALSSETTLSATGELLHEWGREDNGRALYKSGNDFFTERSLTPNEGVIIIDYGAGAVTYFTDDSGVTWTPPTSVTITVTVKDTAGDPINLAQVGIYTPSTGTTGRTELMNKDTNASGIATESYTGTVPISVEVRVRKASAGATKYINYSSLQQISASGLTLAVTMREDPNNNALT